MDNGLGEFRVCLYPRIEDGCLNLAEFYPVIGEDFVKTNRARLDQAETATFPTANRVPAVLQPGSREEVQECLRIAASQDLKIFPISRGKNWGYGSSVPFADGCLLMDLSRMNRILAFDEKLAYVVVEPGVTQQQLSDFLSGARLGRGNRNGTRRLCRSQSKARVPMGRGAFSGWLVFPIAFRHSDPAHDLANAEAGSVRRFFS